jgi:hypothetical protein
MDETTQTAEVQAWLEALGLSKRVMNPIHRERGMMPENQRRLVGHPALHAPLHAE